MSTLSDNQASVGGAQALAQTSYSSTRSRRKAAKRDRTAAGERADGPCPLRRKAGVTKSTIKAPKRSRCKIQALIQDIQADVEHRRGRRALLLSKVGMLAAHKGDLALQVGHVAEKWGALAEMNANIREENNSLRQQIKEAEERLRRSRVNSQQQPLPPPVVLLEQQQQDPEAQPSSHNGMRPASSTAYQESPIHHPPLPRHSAGQISPQSSEAQVRASNLTSSCSTDYLPHQKLPLPALEPRLSPSQEQERQGASSALVSMGSVQSRVQPQEQQEQDWWSSLQSFHTSLDTTACESSPSHNDTLLHWLSKPELPSAAPHANQEQQDPPYWPPGASAAAAGKPPEAASRDRARAWAPKHEVATSAAAARAAASHLDQPQQMRASVEAGTLLPPAFDFKEEDLDLGPLLFLFQEGCSAAPQLCGSGPPGSWLAGACLTGLEPQAMGGMGPHGLCHDDLELLGDSYPLGAELCLPV